MNSIERKERFTELMATIELLPSVDDESYEPVFPKGTLGLSDGNLKTAIMAQAMRGDEDFVGNPLVILSTRSQIQASSLATLSTKLTKHQATTTYPQ